MNRDCQTQGGMREVRVRLYTAGTGIAEYTGEGEGGMREVRARLYTAGTRTVRHREE